VVTPESEAPSSGGAAAAEAFVIVSFVASEHWGSDVSSILKI
jgi:hypothetical protein